MTECVCECSARAAGVGRCVQSAPTAGVREAEIPVLCGGESKRYAMDTTYLPYDSIVYTLHCLHLKHKQFGILQSRCSVMCSIASSYLLKV